MSGVGSRPVPSCTAICRSKVHAARAAAAITLDGTDEQVASYLEGLCFNFCNLVDDAGRSVFHLAASCNRWKLIRWMLTTKSKQLGENATDLRDRESGWTPLHRAIFYGQLGAAKVLVEHGSSLSSLDRDSLSPLSLAIKDRPPYVQFSTAGLYEAYVWGINDNYNLGLGIHQSRQSPELLEFFRKERVNIKQVLMCKFHTVFLSMSGKVYTCGHGLGGRLGHSNEKAMIIPQSVKFVDGPNPPAIVAVAASTDHSAFVAENGTVWTCGLNNNHQLGHCPPPIQQLTPKMLEKGFFQNHSIIGVCSGLCHTVVFAEDAIFTFGLNAGQLGHPEHGDVFQTAPKMVSSLNLDVVKFTHVVASDGATVCATEAGDVYTLHEYKCRKVASKQSDVAHIAVCGGHLDSKRHSPMLKKDGASSELRIAFITKCGRIFLWSESFPFVTRCLISLDGHVHVSHLALFSNDNAVFTTDDGEGFIGHFHKPKVITKTSDQTSKVKASKTFTVFVETDECFHVKVKRLANVFRGVKVACDFNGQNFCIMQANPKIGLLEVPLVSSSDILAEFGRFLSDTHLGDSIHDVIIEVCQHQFAAHRFILASRSQYFRQKIVGRKFDRDVPVLDCSAHVQAAIFHQLLKFIYTDHCDLLTDGHHFDYAITCSGYADLIRRNQPDLVVSTLVDPHKISAFQVAQETGRAEPNSRSPKSPKNRQRASNPVLELQEAARIFGIPELFRKLQCVSYVDEKVVLLEQLPKPLLKYSRNKFPELHDVVIVSKGGREICGHKCVLVARSEYFSTMLTCNWLEAAGSSSVSLPIPADIVELVVGFLYGDDGENFRRADDAEFVCNVLAVADLLLLARLKELCEVVLCDLLTLKNVVNMLEFSSLYSANQLKSSCMNFMGLNLPAILESKTICALSDEALEDLTKTYRQRIPRMCNRVMSNAVIASSSSLLDTINFEDEASCAAFPTTSEDFLDESTVFAAAAAKETAKNDKAARQKSQSTRKSTSSVSSPKGSSDRRQRTVSMCSVRSDTEKKRKSAVSKIKPKSAETFETDHSAVPASQPISPDTTRSPLSAGITCDPPPDAKAKWFGSAEDMDSAFPDLLSEVRRSTSVTHPRLHSKVQRLKSTEKEEALPSPPSLKSSEKLSQKQRKKLAHEAAQTSSPMPIPHSLMMEKYGKSATWGSNDPNWALISLKDRMSTKGIENLCKGASDPAPTPDVKISNEPPVKEVVNVWKRKESENTPRFADILKMEEERRTRLQRMQTKQLKFIQMEDIAMNELLAFYTSHCDDDENIVVERILPDFVATPVWK